MGLILPIRTLAVFLISAGCSHTEAPSPKTAGENQRAESQKSLPSSTKASNDIQQELVSKSKAAILKFQLTSLSPECLLFEISSDAAKKWSLIEVRELHSARCGGDPSTAPRLFTLRFETMGGSIYTDAKSLTGEFEKLECVRTKGPTNKVRSRECSEPLSVNGKHTLILS